MPFSSAWPAAQHEALAGLSLHPQIEWRSTFGEQKRFWQACYTPLSGTPASRRQALFVVEHEHSDVEDRGLAVS